jgi:hypothetical protein
MITPAERYSDLVQLVRDGLLPLEPEARSFARNNGLSMEPLDNALADAYRGLLSVYVNEISRGRIAFAGRAYRVAREHNLPAEEVDLALKAAQNEFKIE